MLDYFGDGQVVECAWGCGALLDFVSLQVDRLVPGWAGGTYRRTNIAPACAPCNRGRSHGSFGEYPDGCNAGLSWAEERIA